MNAPQQLTDKRPKIQLPGDGRLLSDFARDLGKALSTQDIFNRGGMAFIVNERGDGLKLMEADTLRSWVEDHLVCYRVRKVEGSEGTIEFRKTVSKTDASGVLASPQFLEQLSQIERLNPVRMPVMRQDGWIELLPEGFDEPSATFTAYKSAAVITGMPVEQARQVIDELLSEFGFADSGRSKAVTIAAMLTVFAFGLLPKKCLRPCFIALANAEGAGKTLLVKCATVPTLGHAPTGTRPKDEDEMRKILLTATMEARPVIFFDNVRRHLASESLECFLTGQDYEGRILGKSQSFHGENNSVVFITGNGCTVSPDMRRRSLFIELFLEVERAEDRTFKRCLEVPALLEQRTDILSALWAITKDWEKAMMPKPSRSNSSFPEWSAIIGGIVENAGYGCPVEPPQIEAAADVDGADMRALVSAAVNGSTTRSLTFEELVETATTQGLFERFTAGEMDRASKAALAKVLKSYDRRIIGEHRLTLEGKGHSRRYQVEKLNR